MRIANSKGIFAVLLIVMGASAYTGMVISKRHYAGVCFVSNAQGKPRLAVGISRGKLSVSWSGGGFGLDSQGFSAGRLDIPQVALFPKPRYSSHSKFFRAEIPLYYFVVASVVGLTCVVAPWHRFARSALKCSHCGYDLTGIEAPRCPECGTSHP
jgi:hypothetical protein